MEFYKDKLVKIRKLRKLSMDKLAKEIDVTRHSIWYWETGRKLPSEIRVRMLAEALNISVEELSDLKPEIPMAKTDFTEIVKSWLTIAKTTDSNEEDRFNYFIKELTNLRADINNAKTIINVILSSMQAVFYIKDTDMKYVTASNAFLRNVALPIKYNVIGREDKDFFSINEANENTKEDLEILHSGKPLISKEGFIPGSRKKKWCLYSKTPILDSSGKISCIIGLFYDITEMKIAEENRRTLEFAMNKVEDYWIWVSKFVDKKQQKLRRLFINDAVTKFTGVMKEEFIKNPAIWTDFIHPDDIKYVNKARQTKVFPRHMKYRFINTKTGQIFWVHDITYKSGEYLFGLVKDITELKKFYEAQELIRFGIDQIATAIIIYDVKADEYIYANDGIKNFVGYTPDQFIGKSRDFWLNNIVHPNDRNMLISNLKQNKKLIKLEYRYKNSNGEYKWAESIITSEEIFRDKLCNITVSYDITQRKISEEKAKNKTVEIAKNLISNGIPLDVISKSTDISLEDLKKY